MLIVVEKYLAANKVRCSECNHVFVIGVDPMENITWKNDEMFFYCPECKHEVEHLDNPNGVPDPRG